MKNYQDLSNTTLVTVTSVDVNFAKNALMVSSEHCKFGSIKLLSPIRPNNLPIEIEHISIPSIDFLGYSKFMIEELHKYIETEYCLVIQADGFVINPQLWNDDFLNYDYIGAPWPHIVGLNNSPQGTFSFNKNRVGNGGFSFRSKKLLEACSLINFNDLNLPIKSEDIVICHFFYEALQQAGIKFAPLDLASQFSVELLIPGLNIDLSSSFGFHGKHWLSNNYLLKMAENSIYQNEFMSLLNLPLAPQEGQQRRIGRLETCPCGSTKRYKDCHGKII